jgi:hypothetical protein
MDVAGAHEADKYTEHNLDTVICNGVSMYFPSADYLLAVCRTSVAAVQPGGAFYLGDVRANTLFPHFHASVQLYQAPDEMLVDDLKAKVRPRCPSVACLSAPMLLCPVGRLLQLGLLLTMANASADMLYQSTSAGWSYHTVVRLMQVTKSIKFEKEFLVDHDLFLALGDEVPDCAEVRLDMKRGEHHSEFSMFRYDVFFWRADPRAPRSPASYALTPFDPAQHSIAQLREVVEGAGAPELLALARVPDARTVEAGEVMRLLKAAGDGAPETCGQLRKAAAAAAAARQPLEPEELYRLGFASGYHVEMMWSPLVRAAKLRAQWPPVLAVTLCSLALLCCITCLK